jgi:hypothetical protein
MSFDITETLAPKSDQLDSIDLITGPRTFTVASVSQGNSEQPVNVHLVEFPRVWRPSKGMRRVLAACWGAQANEWTGRRVTLYCDPDVTFGKDKVGGTRISHLSHIDGPKKVPMLVAKGRTGIVTVEPLPDAPAPEPVPTEADVQASTDTDLLRSWWKHAHLQGAIKARVDELKAERDANAEPVEPGLFEGGQA